MCCAGCLVAMRTLCPYPNPEPDPDPNPDAHLLASVSAMHCLQRDTRPLAVRVLRWNWDASFSILHFVQTCNEEHS